MYKFYYNQTSEGGAGAYLWTIFGKAWIDWRPIVIPLRFLDEHRN